PYELLLLSRAGALLLGVVALWFYRRGGPLAATVAERQVWSIWIGYLVAYGTSNLVSRALIRHGVLSAGPAAAPGWEEVVRYPIAAILSGLAFFVMGGSFGPTVRSYFREVQRIRARPLHTSRVVDPRVPGDAFGPLSRATAGHESARSPRPR